MNNSFVEDSIEEVQPTDITPMLRTRQDEVVRIIQAVDSIAQSEYWRFLEKEIFQKSLESSVNQLCIEKDDRRVAWLQGRIEILSKYADFKGFSEVYRLELKNIDSKLKVVNVKSS